MRVPTGRWVRDGDQAWIVLDGGYVLFPSSSSMESVKARWMPPAEWRALDRPCDKCGGDQLLPVNFDIDAPGPVDVIDCDCVDGRHTFTVEVPLLVESVAETADVERLVSFRVSVVPGMIRPAVVPGQWVVQVRVHQEEER